MASVTVHLTDSDDVAATLRDIAAQIEDGFTSGYYPHWTLTE
ncbi:hypothetical protein QEH42_gp136 [Microbacterium phage Pumpernickel]|uniref:Uncharacterized protein n=1 Tax=Microbacterium phage Pumpernickel TaxID=2885983 RepID=A0AAE9C312_9CAUD|nr:hypothetical protein QEH42_gp031 [Microbacterium phage Pumpernickel]YP_010755322.1 hypothetical protein QEH42_gp136 [Microbacterium phage Pumpernickel]UDL15822.1 hypothetical protein SEA_PUMPERNICKEL_31 [Microbacterium phage Pumpernickel]UDL16082.1 hypothetical protein SEA_PUMPERNICKEL_332 [Microbacterium phage Pumpernickel]